ncbi:MAG: IS1634 family transposase [Desulfomonile tiedjei]|nr:IS1634 family transposase [Desulfomonile tiedjei]
MFLRRSVVGGHTYLRLVRAYRKEGKNKQEVLFNFGRLDALQATGQLDALVAGLSRFATQQRLIDLSQDLSIDEVYAFGAVHLALRMWEQSGLEKLFKRLGDLHPKRGAVWSGLAEGMVLSRFIRPCSKRRLWLERWEKIYPDLLKVGASSLDGFYRAMDWLYVHRREVEQALFDRNGERDLFNQELDLVFYDTTTLYFESADDQRGKLRRFGYSKEHRFDCVQVVLGLLVDREGIPVGYELFPGNTYDSDAVPAILEKLKSKYRIGRIIFVADRGMLSKDNLNAIRKAHLEFIVGMRLWNVEAKRQETFYDRKRYRWMDKKSKLAIREMDFEGDRLILTWSQERAQRDAQVRSDLLATIRTKLNQASNPKRFVTHRGYRQFLKGLEEGKPELNEEAIDLSQRRDGFFGVRTNIPAGKMHAKEVYARYKDLWHIEDAFGEVKGPLETRPMFHWTDRRIEAHVLICLLAYYLEAVITRTLRQKKAGFTAGEMFRALNQVYAVPIQVRGTCAWVRNELKGVAAEGYRQLNLGPPARVLKIERAGVVTRN